MHEGAAFEVVDYLVRWVEAIEVAKRITQRGVGLIEVKGDVLLGEPANIEEHFWGDAEKVFFAC